MTAGVARSAASWGGSTSNNYKLMNTSNTLDKPAVTKAHGQLLESVTAIKTSVGDGLNDQELTRLLEKSGIPKEEGFEFLSYSDRTLTLSVPKQDPTKWYPEEGWITEEKEKKAREIAQKYELSVCEPPDAHYTVVGGEKPHHHLEMCNGRESVVVVHPQYLKLKLFLSTNSTRSGQAAQRPLSLGPDLLKDLGEQLDGQIAEAREDLNRATKTARQ